MKNDNSVGGEFFDGIYCKDMVMYFCCWLDGLVDIFIELFMCKLFFLLKYFRCCQVVMNMCVIEEWLFWDCEDVENKNDWFGVLLELFYVKDIKFFFCYYFKI